MGGVRAQTIKVTDHRVRLMNDILQAIKLVKLYCWEKNFHDQVSEVGKKNDKNEKKRKKEKIKVTRKKNEKKQMNQKTLEKSCISLFLFLILFYSFFPKSFYSIYLGSRKITCNWSRIYKNIV